MIEIRFKEGEERFALQVSGHALFDIKGKDLVCCAVSTLTKGWYISTKELSGAEIELEQTNDVLKAVVEKNERSMLLYESLKLNLMILQKQYKQNIMITMEDNDGS